MTKPHDPRANQKQRTRAAIVEAAQKMLRSGVEPTVATAAEAAKVSRATAYRYFPTPEALLLEVSGVTPTYEPVREMLRQMRGSDPEERLRQFVQAINDTTFSDEPQMRMALKVYQDTWFAARGEGKSAATVREGRRMQWLDTVLEPADRRLKKSQMQKLKAAIALTVGADAMVIMKDVCRLEDKEAKEVLLWAARVLLRAGLAETGGKA